LPHLIAKGKINTNPVSIKNAMNRARERKRKDKPKYKLYLLDEFLFRNNKILAMSKPKIEASRKNTCENSKLILMIVLSDEKVL